MIDPAVAGTRYGCAGERRGAPFCKPAVAAFDQGPAQIVVEFFRAIVLAAADCDVAIGGVEA